MHAHACQLASARALATAIRRPRGGSRAGQIAYRLGDARLRAPLSAPIHQIVARMLQDRTG
jgi:hypothetical protein